MMDRKEEIKIVKMEDLYNALSDEAQRNRFDIPPLPYIYDKYLEYIATGQFPYIDSVRDFIIKDLPELSPVQVRSVQHHVYLASCVYHRDQERKRCADMEAQGWTMFTPDTVKRLTHGQKIVMFRTGHNILCQEVTKEENFKVFIASDGKTYLMHPRARTRGFHVNHFFVPNTDKAQFFKAVH